MRSSKSHSEPPPPENPSKPGSPSIKHSAQAKSTPKEFQRSSFKAEAGTAKTDYALKPKVDDHTEPNNSPSNNPTNAMSDPDESIYFLPVASNYNTAKRRDRFQSRTSSTKENATRLEEETIETATETAKGSLDKLPTDIAPSRGSLSLATGKAIPNSFQRQDRMLWSPTLSGSSKDSGLESPTLHAIEQIGSYAGPLPIMGDSHLRPDGLGLLDTQMLMPIPSPASPMFRTENNTRGSPPNCPEGQVDRSISRRSSPSSFPAIKQEFSYSPEEPLGQRTKYHLTMTLPANVRTGRPHAPVITGLDPRAKLQVRDAEEPSLQDLAENEHTASKTGDAQTCGSSLYDDFTELRPGAAKELELVLASPNQQRPIYQGQGTNGPHESGQTLGTGSDEPFNLALAPVANLQDSASRTFYNPRPGHSQSTSATIPCTLESNWLLVCARAAQRPTSLFHLDVGSTTSDQQLFAKLRQTYVQAKKASYRSLSFKTVRSIRFVQFELHPRDLVDVRKVPDMPPETKKDDYLYQSCDLLPPVGENLMTHLFHNPHEANEKAITYLRSPKKRKQKLAVCQQMGTNIGWGIHLVEGWAITQLWLSAFAIFSCSFAFAVAWSVLKHDVQGAFGIAGWFVGLATLGLGSFQAVSQGE
ncbi:MAG: hypothetical protein Q9172_004048 [Xanthocarpia lactea]